MYTSYRETICTRKEFCHRGVIWMVKRSSGQHNNSSIDHSMSKSFFYTRYWKTICKRKEFVIEGISRWSSGHLVSITIHPLTIQSKRLFLCADTMKDNMRSYVVEGLPCHGQAVIWTSQHFIY